MGSGLSFLLSGTDAAAAAPAIGGRAAPRGVRGGGGGPRGPASQAKEVAERFKQLASGEAPGSPAAVRGDIGRGQTNIIFGLQRLLRQNQLKEEKAASDLVAIEARARRGENRRRSGITLLTSPADRPAPGVTLLGA